MYITMIKLFFTLLAVLVSVSADANIHRQLSNDRVWQKLLHFNNGSVEIESSDFYLSSPEQKDFLLSELLLTVEASKSNQLDEQGISFRCRYPARVMFLAEHQLIKPIGDGECEEVYKWIGSKDFGISLVYADGFLGNPASFYGHLLLKFDSPNNPTQLLENSLNFGAIVPDRENKVMYILKGLFGGYAANYTSNYFYRHNLNYTELEFRDLWRYPLNLSKYQTKLLAFHAWELMRSEYIYYFTNRNCAYHLAKTIELVLDEDLIDSRHPFVLPISVFQSAVDRSINGKPFIGEIEYLPSKQTRLRKRFFDLSVELQETVKKITTSLEVEYSSAFSLQEQMDILEVAIEHTQFVLNQTSKNSNQYQNLNRFKRQLQLKRIRLPARASKVAENANNLKVYQPQFLPHQGHKGSLLRIDLGEVKGVDSFTELTFRPAFYDIYSIGGGMLENASLTMGELRIRHFNGSTELAKLDLVKIEAYPTGGTGLPSDTDLSWKLRVGLERNYLDNLADINGAEDLEFFVDGGYGKPIRLSENLIGYANLNGRLQSPDNIGNRAFLIPSGGIIFRSNKLRIGCELGYVYSPENVDFSRRKINCESSLFQTRSFDLRLQYTQHYKQSMQVGVSWYW